MVKGKRKKHMASLFFQMFPARLRRPAFIALLLGILLLIALPAEAATIHMRYFESFDVTLDDERYQLFSVSALKGELITVVVYGINEEEKVVPALSMLDVDGITLVEDRNTAGKPLAYAQITASQNGMYPFIVARMTEAVGLVRVMIFVDPPIDYDVTLLDYADPLLPSRAFLIAGSSADPIAVHTEILPPDDPAEPMASYFVSRGTTLALPLKVERFTPVQEFSWMNDNGETFYTINIRPIPEVPPSVVTKSSFPDLQPLRQFLQSFDYLLIIGGGSDEPVIVDRRECAIPLDESLPLFAGPGEEFEQVGVLPPGREFTVVGTDASGEWFQVVDPNQLSGASWVKQGRFVLRRDECGRVQAVFAPASQDEAEQINQNILNAVNALLSASTRQSSLTEQLAPLSVNAAALGSSDGTGITTSGEPAVGAALPPPPPPCTGVNTVTMGGADLNFIGTICDDDVSGNSLDNFQFGDVGNDTLRGDLGNDTLDGGVGNDSLDGGDGDDVFIDISGSNTIVGGAGNDTFNSTAFGGNALIDLANATSTFGSISGVETVLSGGGNDTITSSGANETLNAGGGQDLLDLSASGAPITVDLAGGTANGASIGVDTLAGFEQVQGGAGADSIVGDANNNLLIGNAGSDTLIGGAGNDTLLYGDGDETINTDDPDTDSINGGAGNDTLTFNGNYSNDVVDGGGGSNLFRFLAVVSGIIQLNSSGNDTLDFSGFGSPINLNLGSGALQQVAGADCVTGLCLQLTGSFTGVIGTVLGDNIQGNTAANEIQGLAGDDTINGGDGNDTLFGGTGSDSVEGGLGVDQVYGGSDNSDGVSRDDVGSDTVSDTAGTSGDILYGGNRNTAAGVTGNDGNDTLIDSGGAGDVLYGGNENGAGANGTDGDDSLTHNGSTGNTSLFGGNNNSGGGSGNDNAVPSSGGDTLSVTGGDNDSLFGGNNNGAGGVGLDNAATGPAATQGDQITDAGGNTDQVFGGNLNGAANAQNDDANIAGPIADTIFSNTDNGGDNLVGDNSGGGTGSPNDAFVPDVTDATTQ